MNTQLNVLFRYLRRYLALCIFILVSFSYAKNINRGVSLKNTNPGTPSKKDEFKLQSSMNIEEYGLNYQGFVSTVNPPVILMEQVFSDELLQLIVGSFFTKLDITYFNIQAQHKINEEIIGSLSQVTDESLAKSKDSSCNPGSTDFRSNSQRYIGHLKTLKESDKAYKEKAEFIDLDPSSKLVELQVNPPILGSKMPDSDPIIKHRSAPDFDIDTESARRKYEVIVKCQKSKNEVNNMRLVNEKQKEYIGILGSQFKELSEVLNKLNENYEITNKKSAENISKWIEKSLKLILILESENKALSREITENKDKISSLRDKLKISEDKIFFLNKEIKRYSDVLKELVIKKRLPTHTPEGKCKRSEEEIPITRTPAKVTGKDFHQNDKEHENENEPIFNVSFRSLGAGPTGGGYKHRSGNEDGSGGGYGENIGGQGDENNDDENQGHGEVNQDGDGGSSQDGDGGSSQDGDGGSSQDGDGGSNQDGGGGSSQDGDGGSNQDGDGDSDTEDKGHNYGEPELSQVTLQKNYAPLYTKSSTSDPFGYDTLMRHNAPSYLLRGSEGGVTRSDLTKYRKPSPERTSKGKKVTFSEVTCTGLNPNPELREDGAESTPARLGHRTGRKCIDMTHPHIHYTPYDMLRGCRPRKKMYKIITESSNPLVAYDTPSTKLEKMRKDRERLRREIQLSKRVCNNSDKKYDDGTENTRHQLSHIYTDNDGEKLRDLLETLVKGLNLLAGSEGTTTDTPTPTEQPEQKVAYDSDRFRDLLQELTRGLEKIEKTSTQELSKLKSKLPKDQSGS
ncbi:hypothetical protein FG386_002901 [Cryptosporidium ryanae]|uniref:uncharacterized protein n=1 Tax=Cryptosporidium ryanae TaxID=515981 RepID=UPI00351A7A3E|nr:hypothetical protein FG386_002901 [Cryptosporidium ryanae]